MLKRLARSSEEEKEVFTHPTLGTFENCNYTLERMGIIFIKSK